MHKTDTARLAKLNELLVRLRRGEIVQNRQLRTWLGEHGFKEYEDSWSNAVDLRDTLSSKPSAILDYEKLLKQATMLYNRGETASQRRHRSAKQLHAKAQSAFERALLYLEEQLKVDPSLQMWLDRHCDFSANGDLSLDTIGMPRAITSRSLDNQSGGVAAKVGNKRECKIRAVEAQIDRIMTPRDQSSDLDISDKLRKLKASWK